jgi:hypothetical protein
MATNNGVISQLTTKIDEFMPNAVQAHGYKSSYFTLRTGLKRFDRVASTFLLAARQIESMRRSGGFGMGDCKCKLDFGCCLLSFFCTLHGFRRRTC